MFWKSDYYYPKTTRHELLSAPHKQEVVRHAEPLQSFLKHAPSGFPTLTCMRAFFVAADESLGILECSQNLGAVRWMESNNATLVWNIC